ncbi:SDR family oxidoreductase [Pseudomonas sp. BN414]|uniref:SDR family NAD(P)-dependent oxidoreductase n=1 Tax=Pseudomonas sp. BN414 TaxID=2567888 RepID=UPI002456A470|nr:SDR family oxidoreductase [Pseudomonas sp. BN414]MDH4565205.1 SDR family oxidoreductase [Pseudomonas sp. BN414]
MSQASALPELFELAGKVAVVTGAASGIGKATARLLAAAGAKVVVADKDLPGARAVAEELGNNSFAVGFDLANDDSIRALFQGVNESCGRLDILINNAGIYPRYALQSVTEAQWQDMQKVNVWGCFVVLREAALLMREAGNGGRIVNISSIGGIRTAVHHQVTYNASKAALDSITQSAALEFAGDNILVNSILPGAVAPLDPKPKPASHTSPSGPLLTPGRILLGRAAHANEVAGPILMLVSAAGGYITGQTLIVDGGFSIS